MIFNTSVDDVSGNSKSIYQKFCQEIFGVYIERPVIKEDEQEDNYLADRRYELTINCLHSFQSILDPFKNLWPEYSDENYLSDYHSTVWVTANDLSKLSRKIGLALSMVCARHSLTSAGLTACRLTGSYESYPVSSSAMDILSAVRPAHSMSDSTIPRESIVVIHSHGPIGLRRKK